MGTISMKTPWGMLWGVAMFVMIVTIILGVIEGYSVREATIFGLYAGPGWLALLTVAALIWRACKQDGT